MTIQLRTLPEALDDAARSGEGYTFVAGGVEVPRSYRDIQRDSFAVARALGDAGLGRGDVIALIIEDAERFLTTLFGASLAGLIPAPLAPPTVTADRSRYFALTAGILRVARARAVVTSMALAAGFEALGDSCPDLALVLSSDDLESDPVEPERLPALDDVALVQFTSGSTSAPKGVALSHRSLSANIEAINGPSGLGTTDDDSAVSWLPLYHDMGLVGMALGPLYSARPAVLLTPQAFIKRPADWLKAISRHRATVSFAPNFAYDLVVRRIKDRDLDGLDLSRWRIAGCGAEPIHAPTLAAFSERLAGAGFRATSFLPCYGLAEHVLAATLPPRNRLPRVEQIAAVPLVSCGGALPGHQIRIFTEDGREAREHEIGEIALAGPSVMSGYYDDEHATAETIRNGWLHTGDLGYLSDGELFVCGRAKDLIIVNGRKYHPQDLEWAVAEVDGVHRGRVVAFGMAEPGAGDRIVMAVETTGTDGFDAMADRIRKRISDAFGLYVDEVAALEIGSIGRTTSGKIQRAAAKAAYERLKA